MKLCVDCKWCIKTEWNWLERVLDRFFGPVNVYNCSNPKVCYVDRVTGKTNLLKCSVARDLDVRCGEIGKYWEPK